MRMEKIEKKGVLDVVDWACLHMKTLEGWSLVAMIQEEGSEIQCETVPAVRPDASYGETVNVTKYMPKTETKFLIHQDEDSVLKGMAEKVEEAEKATMQLNKHLAVVVEEKDKVQELLKTVERNCESIKQSRDDYKKDFEQVLAANNKMEKSIGKIREAIGTQRMDEILKESKDGV